jgi:hypothetical protein
MAQIVKRKNYQNRQRGYTDNYVIAFQQEDNGTITIWAEERPNDPYRIATEAHVALDGEKVCISGGKEPRSLERAEAIAHTWMLGYSEYIRSGTFPKGTRRLNI